MARAYDPTSITAPLVKQLIEEQFPQWANLPIFPVKESGHDNRTFHLGSRMAVRMPSGELYARHVPIEHVWLPKLAPQLPQPIPMPLGKGVPGIGYPWPWSVNSWLHGEPASVAHIPDLCAFARDLAAFLNTLQSIDTSNAPPPGENNFFRGGSLSVYDTETHECISTLKDTVDAYAASSVWQRALKANWERTAMWVHGDVAGGNLLVDGGRLCGVIDFGQVASGDPACDFAIAWTFFSGPSREVFRTELDVDDATWARGRGWAFWKALLELRSDQACHTRKAQKAKSIILDILSEQR